MSIQVRNLTHIYSEGMPFESVALDNVSFEINDGEFVGIIGHTGSGKSTLVQHFNGLLKPKSGSILIGDVDITKPGVPLREIRKRIGLVFQYPEYQLFEESVKKDVAFGPENLGLDPAEIESRVREAIELVGLNYDEIAERSPFELSGGQKRRVAIAGVIAMKPEILVLDEPTAGLDPKAHKDLLDVIQRIHQEQGIILILVSHNMRDIARLSDKVLVMEGGKLVMCGTPREIFGQRDKLVRMGLSVPPVAELMHRLADKGLPLEANVLTMDEAVAELLKHLK
ncbi:energy-coupling factor transporter ATPase [Clostridium aminobutyricum]|uniref:Energy-coupling factor transporter ATP-binding protein EcfA2 n=1 Tax=Clostridium aminobutyricum TaxID=33953 RepID=A0A939IJK3_CLOAM|nr:energy-coupling factor transporter ATPase [Clostridium aminobutyricum]MBN7773669.1 energy-coupling factor transporter ATPase [Clostridium aminobutyricum]